LEVLLNQDEFGSNCAVDKHIKILVKISMEIRIRPIFKRSNIDRSLVWSCCELALTRAGRLRTCAICAAL